MSEKLFTKSAFNVALKCPMQAYYYRNFKDYAYHYAGPDGIAEVGDQFGALARVYEGVPDENIIRMDKGDAVAARAKAIEQTKSLLRNENVDIAEAAFGTDLYFVLADILHKHGDDIDIIEVKSKGIRANEEPFSFDERGNFKSDYLEKILDVTFQKYVIESFIKSSKEFSHLKVHAKLMLANEDVSCDVASLSSLLQIKKIENGRIVECAPNIEKLLQGSTRITRTCNVDFLCNDIIADRIPKIAQCFGGNFVKFAEKMAYLYVNNIQDFTNCNITTNCFKCPYHKEAGDKEALDGHVECFKKLAGIDISGKATIMDVKGGSNGLPSNWKKGAWLTQKKFLLTDINEYEYVPADKATPEAIQNKDKLSTDDLRFLHVHSVKNNIAEPTFLKAAAKAAMVKWDYPLHFIDFETYMGAVPLFKGNRPNEEIAYQFSHHIGYEDGSFKHAGEFISLEPGKFPNFEFIRELKRQLENDNGTIFRYDIHENNVLNAIREQLMDSDEPDKSALIKFIESITHPTKECKAPFTPTNRDMKDLKIIAQDYFYHPSMGSSNSIKQVMPAILKSHPYFREKYGDDMDPYHNLPSLGEFVKKIESGPQKELFPADFDDSDVFDAEKQVNHGGISKLDYVQLQAGRFNKLHTEAFRQAALKYCELDTLSMVRIWEYFRISTKE